MVRCPWCEREVSLEEYGRHYDTCPQRSHQKTSPEAYVQPLARPVTIEGVTIRTKAEADGFRTLYSSIMSIYNEFNDKCVATRAPYWCTSAHILGTFTRKLMRVHDELKAQVV